MDHPDTPGATGTALSGNETVLGGTATATDDSLRTLVRVPGNHLMTDLLGTRDELLDIIEDAFPAVAIIARGNEITITGPGADRDGDLVATGDDRDGREGVLDDVEQLVTGAEQVGHQVVAGNPNQRPE